MKRILRKNRLMITVLAVMVAAAGYLNYNGASLHTATETETKQTANVSNVTEDIDSLDFDITDTTALLAENQSAGEKKDSEGENVTGETVVSTLPVTSMTEETETADTGKDNETQKKETDTQTKTDQKNSSGNTDKADTGQSSSSTTTKETSDSIPGETVLTSTAAAYVTQARLEREQVRAKNKEVLQNIIDNKQLSQQEIENAVQSMAALTEYAEKEAAAETLLKAQGFENAIVSMTGDSVDVVVDAASLDETNRARIEDAVTRKTGVSVDKIVITPVRSQQ